MSKKSPKKRKTTFATNQSVDVHGGGHGVGQSRRTREKLTRRCAIGCEKGAPMHVYKATPSGFIPHGVTGWPHGAMGANGALTHFHKKKVQTCVWRNSEPRKCVRKVQKCVRKNPSELSRHIFKSPDKKNVSGKSPKMCPETPKMCPEKSWRTPQTNF